MIRANSDNTYVKQIKASQLNCFRCVHCAGRVCAGKRELKFKRRHSRKRLRGEEGAQNQAQTLQEALARGRGSSNSIYLNCEENDPKFDLAYFAQLG